jgi:cold shock CspA family protein
MSQPGAELKGTVHSFNADDGCGYIIAQDGRLFFVHYGDVETPVEGRKPPLAEGDEVVFEISPERGAEVATNVRKAG